MSLDLLAEQIAGEWVSNHELDVKLKNMSWNDRWQLLFGGREWSKHIEQQRLDRNLGYRPACYRGFLRR